MSTELVIPFEGQKPSAAFASLAPTESLAEGIGSSYPVIGYKGKNWSLRYRGDRHMFTRADDGTPLPYLDVIILRQASAKSKSFYEGGFVEGASDGKRPVCASLNGVTPDTDVVAKQCDTCVLCPRNEWKVDQNGRKTRECSDYKRLAVLVLPNLTKAILGAPLMEPAFLRVPPASLNDLGIFGDTMSRKGFHFSTFITRVAFDPEQSHPKFVFKPLQQLSDAEAPVVLAMREDPMALRITGEDQAVKQQLAAPTKPVEQPVVQAAPAKPPEPAGLVDAGFGPAVTVKVTEKPTQKAEAPQLDMAAQPGGAFGLAQEAVGDTQPKAAVQTAEDIGEATDSDADLDARIRQMLGA
jgi:hypothetical protein